MEQLNPTLVLIRIALYRQQQSSVLPRRAKGVAINRVVSVVHENDALVDRSSYLETIVRIKITGC